MDGSFVKVQFDPFGTQQTGILLDHCIFGAVRICTKSSSVRLSSWTVTGKRPWSSGIISSILATWKPSPNEEDKVRLHRAILGGHCAAFNNGQDVPLDPFPGNIRAIAAVIPNDFVDFINEVIMASFDAVMSVGTTTSMPTPRSRTERTERRSNRRST